MEQVLTLEDFAAARAVSSVELSSLGFVPVCMVPGEENPGHSHTLVEEILVVQKGIGKIQIESVTHDLAPGSVAIVPAGRFHAACNTGSENLEGIVIFNSDFDRDQMILKDREKHFADATERDVDLLLQIKALKKANKKLKKKLKKMKR